MFQRTVVEKMKTHILFLATFFQKFCHLRDNVEKYGRSGQATDDNITWHMCIACWMTKATETSSEYIQNIAFPQLHWLCKHTSVLRYVYIACLVITLCNSIRMKMIIYFSNVNSENVFCSFIIAKSMEVILFLKYFFSDFSCCCGLQ